MGIGTEWGDQDSYRDNSGMIKHPPRLTLSMRRDTLEAKHGLKQSELDVEELEPGVANSNDSPPPYNPFNYCYALILEEMNLEVAVRFYIEGLDHREKHAIEFQHEGQAYVFPFFPRSQEGPFSVNPASTYEGVGDVHNFYRNGEYTLQVVPMIVRAKVFGDGDREDALITKELCSELVSPERLKQALLDFRDQVQNDRNAPVGLRVVLNDVLKGDFDSFDSGSDWDEADDDGWAR